jgi:hypothetical protein
MFSAVSSSGGTIVFPANVDAGSGGVVERVNATIAITLSATSAASAIAVTFSFDRRLVLIPRPSP